MSALRHLQISAGLPSTTRSDWPRLQYVLKGIKRSQPQSGKQRLPITSAVMSLLRTTWATGIESDFETRLLWAASCLAFFGFLRSGELSLESSSSQPAILRSDVAVDSHSSPSMLSVHLRRAKTDPFGRGVTLYLGRSGSEVCPVAAVLNYLVTRPAPDGPLFVHSDGSPLLKRQFVAGVRRALSAAGLDSASYSGHSFRIGAATSAAASGVPDHLIKTLGRWESSAYQLYIRTPRQSLAAVSHLLMTPPGSE